MADEIKNETLNEGEPSAEKTFTQAELDNIVAKRVARATKGMPTDEELNEFRDWQKNHNDTIINNLKTERDTAQSNLAKVQAEIDEMKQEKYLLNKGVDVDDVDYYIFMKY